jgi:hypothetical protein
MTHQAVLLCTTEPAVEGQPAVPFFADLAEVLDSPCGHIAKLGEEILALSGMDVGDKANPT